MGSTSSDWYCGGALTANTASITGPIDTDAGLYSGEGADTSDPTDYSWFFSPGDGTNPPRLNRFETYDWGTGAWRGIYLDNGDFYAI